MDAMLQELIDNGMNIEQNIRDNKLVFFHNDKEYRIRLPEPADEREATKRRKAKRMELLNQPNFMMRDKLIEVYKEKGVDIAAMDKEMLDLDKQINDRYIRTVHAVKAGREKEVEQLREEVNELRLKQSNISAEKASLLSYSVEDQEFYYFIQTLVALCTETKEGDDWVRVFEDAEAFDGYADRALVSGVSFVAGYMFTRTEA